MGGMFIPAAQAAREQLDWGSLAWCCRPETTGAKGLVVIEVTLAPGGGHAFHKHQEQDEVIYVIDGEVQQWLDQGKRTLRSGDSVYLPAGTVHASFNVSNRDAKLLAILSPCLDVPNGYAVTEVAGESPWKSLR